MNDEKEKKLNKHVSLRAKYICSDDDRMLLF